MATEDEGIRLDVGTLQQMALDRTALSRTARGTIIYVYVGSFADPTSLSGLHFAEFLGFDTARGEVHYRTIPEPPQRIDTPGSIRAMVTDQQSGLLLPEGVRDPQPIEKRVLLDEDYIILDGGRYAAYMADAANMPQAGDDLY